jgi:hypothetical protein
MLTVKKAPVFIVPSGSYGKGTGFEGHEFFEASSIRKRGDTYYFVYSSVAMNELCYATAKYPDKDFKYGGVIVSNCDLHIDSYKPASKKTYPAGNNHGSIIEINGEWYIFYHRMTNGTWYSRQGCMERIHILGDGSIPQAEMTSLGANGEPLIGRGEYPAYIACNLFCESENPERRPKITQYGADGDEEPGYIADIVDSTVIGFKYFLCTGVKKVSVRTRGYFDGFFEVRTSLDAECLGKIPVANVNIWTSFSSFFQIPDGTHALYFTYRGKGNSSLASFELI